MMLEKILNGSSDKAFKMTFSTLVLPNGFFFGGGGEGSKPGSYRNLIKESTISAVRPTTRWHFHRYLLPKLIDYSQVCSIPPNNTKNIFSPFY